MGIDNCEVGLSGGDQLQFPADLKLLKSPDIWIGDSCALGHCTAHLCGAVNIRDGTTTTTGISGGIIKATMEVVMECIHCNKHGNELRKIVFKVVSYIESANYNLCSLSRIIQE